MAGVAFAVEGDGVGFATESYAASALYTTLASLSGALWRIRRAKEGCFFRKRWRIIKELPGPLDYDPRQRPWYKDADRRDGSALTGPYVFLRHRQTWLHRAAADG